MDDPSKGTESGRTSIKRAAWLAAAAIVPLLVAARTATVLRSRRSRSKAETREMTGESNLVIPRGGIAPRSVPGRRRPPCGRTDRYGWPRFRRIIRGGGQGSIPIRSQHCLGARQARWDTPHDDQHPDPPSV